MSSNNTQTTPMTAASLFSLCVETGVSTAIIVAETAIDAGMNILTLEL